MLLQLVTTKTNALTDASLRMWHEKLGHINANDLQLMEPKRVVQGHKITEKGKFFCRDCPMGNQHRLPIKVKKNSHQYRVGKMIHSDVEGPKKTTSLGGARFYVVFKDDRSGYRKVYYMKNKSDAFENFKYFAAMIKNKFNFK